MKKLGAERQSQDNVSIAIEEAAKTSMLNMSDEEIEKLKRSLSKLVNRRIDEKRENELAMNVSPVRAYEDFQPPTCCQVARRCKQFIDYTKGKETVLPDIVYPVATPVKKQQKSGSKRSRKRRDAEETEYDLSPDVKCNHGQTEQEIFEECVELYQKFITFKEELRMKLERELENDVLAKGIIKMIKEEDESDSDDCLEVFQNENKLCKIL